MQELCIFIDHRATRIIVRSFASAAVLVALSAGCAFGASRRPVVTASSVRARRAPTERLAELGVREIVFAARENGADGHWYANFGYYAPDRNRKCYRKGGRLCKLDVTTGKVALLVDDPNGSVRDPVVDYDAKKILFSWRRSGTEYFHLYEINVDPSTSLRAGGSGPKQLTSGEYDDIEPTYLPDGGIMFVSSRAKRWVNCWLTQVGTLYRCDRDGGNVRQISANIEHDNTPSVLPDGRIIYQRWEYIDRSQVHYHHLWTTNPDGTGQMVYFGNMHPGSVFIDARAIPGTNKVVCINSPGHGANEHRGHVAIVTGRFGPDNRSAMRNISGNGYRDPYPLSENAFIVVAGRKMVLMDADGGTMDIYSLGREYGRAGLHEPRPIIKRERERVVPSRVDLAKQTGQLILADVYNGRNMKGAKHGEIKKLLVLESLPKPINFTGGMDPMSYGGTFTLARVVGTVPLEADGSANMELPANRALFFVALDENEASVKRMQSFLTVMPGEVTSCVGCHEQRVKTPENKAARGRLQAMLRPPGRIAPVEGIPEVLDFPRDIQPILDKHCIKCHGPEKHKGGVLLAGDHGPMFSHSYFTLTWRRQVADGRNLPKSNYPPRALGDSASPLMKKLDPSHYKVQASAAEVRMVRYWINSGAAYPGTYAALGGGMIGGYEENRLVGTDRDWPARKAYSQVIRRRCASCHKGASRLPSSLSDELRVSFWQPRMTDPRLRFSRHRVFNLTRPEKSLVLLAPLSRAAGGCGMPKRTKDGKPTGEYAEVFKNTSDPDYRAVLALCAAGRERLEKIKRFDMPGFKPRPQYIREMKKYGILPASFDLAKDPVNVYELDRRYWQSLWYYPPGAERPKLYGNSKSGHGSSASR